MFLEIVNRLRFNIVAERTDIHLGRSLLFHLVKVLWFIRALADIGMILPCCRLTDKVSSRGSRDGRETYQQSLEMFSEISAPGYIKVLEDRMGYL